MRAHYHLYLDLVAFKNRLWSCEVAIGKMFLPSIMQMKLLLHLREILQYTTRDPASPICCLLTSSIASKASWLVIATITPLPAAKPSALITIGAPFC